MGPRSRKKTAWSLGLPFFRVGQDRTSRFYIAAVVTLAVFSLCVIFIPTAPQSYVLETRLRQEFSGPEQIIRPILLSDVTDSLREQSFLRRVTQRLAAPTATEAGAVAFDLKKLGEQLQISVTPDSLPATTRMISIQLRGADRALTQKVLSCLAETYASEQQRVNRAAEKEAQLQEVLANMSFWRSRLNSLRAELDAHVEGELSRREKLHLRQVAQAADSEARPGDSIEAEQPEERPPSAVASPSPVAEMTAEHAPLLEMQNTRWNVLRQQLAEAEVNLVRLRESHTDEHPLVIESQRVVNRLRLALLDTPPTIQRAPSSNPFVVSQPANAAGSPAKLTCGRTQETQFDRKSPANHLPAWDAAAVRRTIESEPTATRLRESLQEAEQQLAALTSREQALSQPSEDYGLTTSILSPPKLVRSIRQPVNRATIMQWLIPALGIGLICCVPRAKGTIPSVLFSVQDVEESLRTPIAGTLPMHHGPDIPRWAPSTLPNWVRGTVWLSELALCGVFLLVLICLLVIPGFAAQTAADPLGTLNTALELLKY